MNSSLSGIGAFLLIVALTIAFFVMQVQLEKRAPPQTKLLDQAFTLGVWIMGGVTSVFHLSVAFKALDNGPSYQTLFVIVMSLIYCGLIGLCFKDIKTRRQLTDDLNSVSLRKSNGAGVDQGAWAGRLPG
jgi:Na+/alanine symporter